MNTNKAAIPIYESTLRAIEMYEDREAGRLARIIVDYGFAVPEEKKNVVARCSEDALLILKNVFSGIDLQVERYNEKKEKKKWREKITMYR